MRFKSCNWITHGITFETTHMEMCCMRSHAGGGNLFVKNPYNGELMDWDKFFELKKKFIEGRFSDDTNNSLLTHSKILSILTIGLIVIADVFIVLRIMTRKTAIKTDIIMFCP